MRWREVATEPDAIGRVLAELELQDSDDTLTTHRTTSRRYRAPPPEQLGLRFR